MAKAWALLLGTVWAPGRSIAVTKPLAVWQICWAPRIIGDIRLISYLIHYEFRNDDNP